jgi:hypothetical protein
MASRSINYDFRKFVSTANSANGEVSDQTVFHYRQRDDVVWATYEGGDVRLGTLVATVDASGRLDMRYSHVNSAGELMTGHCHSNPEVMEDGRLRLHESWQWTSGDKSRGESVVEEIS